MSKKLFVGNISFKATEEALKEVFSQAGEVESVKIITDAQTGQPKGFGFVEMVSEEDAQRAIASLNGTMFMDRALSVAEARPQQPREKRGFGGRGGFGGSRNSGFGGGGGKGKGQGYGRGRR
ncbi:MAG: RNA-binding protein [Nitrospirae bacterium]|nr:RNA-binding protein [Nitrospirota bacterium]MCL5236896.1 RNA-binding protein [Nitrospirota bacterium]